MDQHTERMIRTDIRLRTAPFFILVWLGVLSALGIIGLVGVAVLVRWAHTYGF
jgi:hypothetical protein